MKDSTRAWRSCRGPAVVIAAASTLALAAAAGCATEPATTTRPMSGVMASKLRHAQATLVAVMVADYPAIRTNAMAMKNLSADSLAVPQDTVAFGVLADEFRDVAGLLAAEAQREDLDGVTTAYLELTRTCVACHKRVNRERKLGNLPHKVSWAVPDSGP
jgi:cytochrome c556